MEREGERERESNCLSAYKSFNTKWWRDKHSGLASYTAGRAHTQTCFCHLDRHCIDLHLFLRDAPYHNSYMPNLNHNPNLNQKPKS